MDSHSKVEVLTRYYNFFIFVIFNFEIQCLSVAGNVRSIQIIIRFGNEEKNSNVLNTVYMNLDTNSQWPLVRCTQIRTRDSGAPGCGFLVQKVYSVTV